MQQPTAHPPDPWRWMVMLAFGAISFANGSAQAIFSPILNQAQIYFNRDFIAVIWQINVWSVSYLIFAIPVLITLISWRLTTSLYVSAFLNCVGAWIRYAAARDYWLSLFGALVIAMSQLWSLSAPAIIIDRWFPASERVLVVSISMGTSIVGISFGYMISAGLVNCVNCSEDIQNAEIDNMLFYQGIWMSVPLILTLIFVREKPKYAANALSEVPKQGFAESIRSLFSRKRSWINLSWIAIVIGFAWTFEALVAKILEPLNLTVLENGYVGLVMNVSGAVGAVAASIIMERELTRKSNSATEKGIPPNYDLYTKIFIGVSYALSILLTVLMSLNTWQLPMPLTYILCTLIGLGQNAAIPFMSQAFLEDSYPTNEITAFNAVFYFPQAATFLLNLLTTVGLWLMDLVVFPFVIFLLFFYKTRMLRFEAEYTGTVKQCLKYTNSELLNNDTSITSEEVQDSSNQNLQDK